MASKPGFLDYVTAAFNARPLGMFVAPNWVGLAAFGLLGVSNPGFWVLGAGLELGYLLTLATSSRFQRAISSRPLAAARTEWNERIQRLSSRLDRNDRERFQALSQRCASIIDLQTHGGSETPQGIETQTDSLGRLSWMFLRLLVARSTILSVVREGEDEQLLAQRRGTDRNPAAADRPARRGGAQAGLHRRGARANRGAGGVDPRPGGIVDGP